MFRNLYLYLGCLNFLLIKSNIYGGMRHDIALEYNAENVIKNGYVCWSLYLENILPLLWTAKAPPPESFHFSLLMEFDFTFLVSTC